MQLFILTLHCTSQAHCKVCRNKEGGRVWRKQIGKVYELPPAKPEAVDPADFECPYGIDWGTETVPQSAKFANKPNLAQTATPPKPDTLSRDSGSRNQRKGCGCSRSG